MLVLSATLAIDYVDLSQAQPQSHSLSLSKSQSAAQSRDVRALPMPQFSPVNPKIGANTNTSGRRGRAGRRGVSHSESEPAAASASASSVWPAQTNEEFELDLLLKQMHRSAEERYSDRPKFEDAASEASTGSGAGIGRRAGGRGRRQPRWLI